MTTPLCKIARETGGEVPLSCLFGCAHGCGQDRPPMRLAKQDVTCRNCGVDAYWQEMIGPDGRPKIRLFANGKPHECRSGASADEFPDET